MHVRIVTFHLNGITPELFEQHCEQIADGFNEWPGLVAKVWLSDRETNTYGGVYLFESRAAADRSRTTDTFAGMCQNPGFADLSVREYATLEGPTAITASALRPLPFGGSSG